MPTATIGIMNKKINSTKTSFSGTSHNVVLKAPTSRENPRLLITGAPTSKANYMSYNGWYYWIDDIVSMTKDLSWVVAHVDPLSTWKSDIMATTGFINYGPPSKVNKNLVDPRLTADVFKYTAKENLDFSFFDNIGFVHLVVTSYDTNKPGVYHIVGSTSAFKEIYNQYIIDMNNDTQTFMQDFEKVLIKILGFKGALEYITSATWVPFKMTDFIGAAYSGGLGPYGMYGTWYEANHWDGTPANAEEKTVQLANPAELTTYPWLYNQGYTKIFAESLGGVIDITTPLQMYGLTTQKYVVRAIHNIYGDVCFVFKEEETGTILGLQQFNCAVDLMQYMTTVPNPAIVGAKLGVQIGTSVISGLAGAGAAMTSASQAIGEAAIAKESSAGLSVAAKMESAGNRMQGMFGGSTKAIADGVNGAVGSVGVAEGPAQFTGPNNLCALKLISDSFTSEQVRIRQFSWLPEIIDKGTYDDFMARYGGPVFSYGSLGSAGPYQMAGATCAADAPPSALSVINSTINNLIIIE